MVKYGYFIVYRKDIYNCISLQGKSAWQIKKKPAEENKLRILKLVGRVFDNLLGPEYKFYHHYKGLQMN